MHAYEEAICATASKDAPWFVVPADNKWFSRLVVAAAIVEAVEQLDLEYPKVTQDQRKELAAARAELIAENEGWSPAPARSPVKGRGERG
jgi:hypothetical protein